jgi:hypothetical protein
MVEQIDIWRAARVLLKQHGYEKALAVAAERAADLAVGGDQRGALVFKAICECLREWQRKPDADDAVN